MDKRLLAFSHIPKTAGTTLNLILKRHFGFHHVAVEHRTRRPLYTQRDLSIDLKLHPGAQSLAGHTLKPFVDFGPNDERLVWYTFLRDPIDRFVSHYQHQFTSGIPKFQLPFVEWMQRYERQNWMVRMLAGEEDIEAAKEILTTRMQFVGFTERFDESLILLRHCLQLHEMDVDYVAPSNISSINGVRRHISDHIEEYKSEILDRNSLDIELVRFAMEEIWPRQVAQYGIDHLANDLERIFTQAPIGFMERCNVWKYVAYRNLVYKPYVWIDRKYLL